MRAGVRAKRLACGSAWDDVEDLRVKWGSYVERQSTGAFYHVLSRYYRQPLQQWAVRKSGAGRQGGERGRRRWTGGLCFIFLE